VTQRSYNVLFVCADNSICSTMAEAILKRSGLGDFHAFSAGVRPRDEMKPVVAEFLKAHGIWHQDFASTGCSRFLASHAPRMDFIISLGEQTPAGLPAVWPGDPQIVHWHITREQSEFELPVPVYKLSERQHHVRICDGPDELPCSRTSRRGIDHAASPPPLFIRADRSDVQGPP
jgi:protein-tyrosine-phosphatase